MSTVRKVLEALTSSFGDGQLTVGELIYHPYKMLYGDLKKIYKSSEVGQAVKRAEARGLVKKKIINEQAYVAITKFGGHKLKDMGEKPKFKIELGKKSWDGKYRLVLF